MTITKQELTDEKLALALQEAEMRNYSTKLGLIKLQKSFPNMPKEQLKEYLHENKNDYRKTAQQILQALLFNEKPASTPAWTKETESTSESLDSEEDFWQKARKKEARKKEARKKEAEYFFRKNNERFARTSSDNYVDFHNLHRDEAIKKLEQVIAEVTAQGHYRQIFIITGQGRHSKGNKGNFSFNLLNLV